MPTGRTFHVLLDPERDVPEESTRVHGFTAEMLRGIVARLEAHHGVRVLDEAVVGAVRLSHRYMPGRRLPDKAVSVLDTACARVAVAHGAPPAVLELGLSRELAPQMSEPWYC